MSLLAKLRADENCLFLLARFMAEYQASVMCAVSIVGTVKYAESSKLRFRSSSAKVERSVAAPVSERRSSSIDIASVYCAADRVILRAWRRISQEILDNIK